LDRIFSPLESKNNNIKSHIDKVGVQAVELFAFGQARDKMGFFFSKTKTKSKFSMNITSIIF
jgi:hypothetical protein